MTESGRCQCGEIHYSFERDKIISGHHCHCKDCQRATGSGKSTIHKILSGIEKEYNREIIAAKGIKDGYLAQKPE